MIRFQVKYGAYIFSKDFFAKVLDYAIGKFFDYDAAEKVAVDLMVVSDPEITELNKLHKDKDNPTDVLAFYDGEEDPDENEIHLGDVVISSDTAYRESKERGIPFEEELLLYAVHGVLHLLGFRDKTDEERSSMREAEREVLGNFSIKPNWM